MHIHTFTRRILKRALLTLGIALIPLGVLALVFSYSQKQPLDARVVFYFPDTDPFSLEGRAASHLEYKGIISGRPDGTFDGNGSLNRAEAAKMILGAAKIRIVNIPVRGRYSDVTDQDWFVSFVMTATRNNIMEGFPDETFGPNLPVTTAEFLKIITKAFKFEEGYASKYQDVFKKAWYARFTAIAEDRTLFPDRIDLLYPDKPLTRKDVAIALYKILIDKEKKRLDFFRWTETSPNRTGGRGR